MKTLTSLVLTALLAVFLTACGPITITIGGTPAVQPQGPSIEEAMTAAIGTLQAQQTASAQPVAGTPAPQIPSAGTGSIAGRTSGPEFAKVVAFAVGSSSYYSYIMPLGQTNFQIDSLPPGQYYVLAYTNPTQFTASAVSAYSQYVLCGMAAACTDHALVPVTVQAGQLTSGINILDTFQMPNFPMDPLGTVAQPTPLGGNDVIPTNTPPGGLVGSISGNAQYPAEGLPPLTIIAFRVGVPNEYYSVQTVKGQGGYQIDNLPVGTYTVVAYTLGGGGIPANLAGGYTQYVKCGMVPPCSNHALMEVTVSAGQVTSGVDPADWYMPAGTYPSNPLP